MWMGYNYFVGGERLMPGTYNDYAFMGRTVMSDFKRLIVVAAVVLASLAVSGCRRYDYARMERGIYRSLNRLCRDFEDIEWKQPYRDLYVRRENFNDLVRTGEPSGQEGMFVQSYGIAGLLAGYADDYFLASISGGEKYKDKIETFDYFISSLSEKENGKRQFVFISTEGVVIYGRKYLRAGEPEKWRRLEVIEPLTANEISDLSALEGKVFEVTSPAVPTEQVEKYKVLAVRLNKILPK
jgi:hypothetical protein